MSGDTTVQSITSAQLPTTIDEATALLRSIESSATPNSFIVLPHNTASYVVSVPGAVIMVLPGEEVTINDETDGDTAIIVGDGATLRYRTVSKSGGKLSRTVYAMRGASVDWADAMLCAGADAINTIYLAAEGAHAKFRGVFLGVSGDRYVTSVRMVHAAPKTSSHMLTRAALLDDSTGSYRGLIRILPHAHGCDAHQRADTLLIGHGAHMDALPVLEIENDDVRCSHGVTMGRVDDDKMFYLRSRGLRADDARALLVQGFFDQVLISMGDDGKRVQDMFAEKLVQTAAKQ